MQEKNKRDREDPLTKDAMQEKDENVDEKKSADKSEPHMDGPHLCDPGETSNKSSGAQDEGKIYDL